MNIELTRVWFVNDIKIRGLLAKRPFVNRRYVSKANALKMVIEVGVPINTVSI